MLRNTGLQSILCKIQLQQRWKMVDTLPPEDKRVEELMILFIAPYLFVLDNHGGSENNSISQQRFESEISTFPVYLLMQKRLFPY